MKKRQIFVSNLSISGWLTLVKCSERNIPAKPMSSTSATRFFQWRHVNPFCPSIINDTATINYLSFQFLIYYASVSSHPAHVIARANKTSKLLDTLHYATLAGQNKLLLPHWSQISTIFLLSLLFLKCVVILKNIKPLQQYD